MGSASRSTRRLRSAGASTEPGGELNGGDGAGAAAGAQEPGGLESSHSPDTTAEVVIAAAAEVV